MNHVLNQSCQNDCALEQNLTRAQQLSLKSVMRISGVLGIGNSKVSERWPGPHPVV